jgi:hypothetical protein
MLTTSCDSGPADKQQIKREAPGTLDTNAPPHPMSSPMEAASPSSSVDAGSQRRSAAAATAADADAERAAARIYSKFSDAQRAELRDSLLQQLAAAGDWKGTVDDRVARSVEARLEDGGACDPHDVIGDVMPHAMASVDDAVRRDLMAQVQRMLRLPPAE